MEQMTLQDRALCDGIESKPVEAQACKRSPWAWRMVLEGNIISGT
jgi:hypothetical protein